MKVVTGERGEDVIYTVMNSKKFVVHKRTINFLKKKESIAGVVDFIESQLRLILV